VTFEYEKETKNSVRYQEIPEEGKRLSWERLCFQKWLLAARKR